MNEYAFFIETGVIGLLLGLFFFGGLWLTITRMAHSQNPAILFLLSFLLRMSLVLVGFYFLLGENWQSLLLAGVGFTAARFIVKRLLHFKCPEASHAS